MAARAGARTTLGARTKARKRALDVLYEADVRSVDPLCTLGEQKSRGVRIAPYTATLVEGVRAHRAEIDGLLAAQSVGWPLERMPAVDRNLLRIGAFELLYGLDVPAPVAVSEAVTLAQTLSTAESPAFVNGVLAGLLSQAERTRQAAAAEASAEPPAGSPAGGTPDRPA